MQEMGFPDTACIAFRLSKAVYRPLFELVWGADFDIRWPGDTEKICATPGGAARFGGSATPIRLSPKDRTRANNIYDHWALTDVSQQLIRTSTAIQVSA
jgi:cytochrome c peroxidase